MSTHDSSVAAEALDLTVLNMDTQEAEKEVARILAGIPGIESVRLFERGAYLRYDPTSITKEQICDVLHKASYRAGVFQDSWSGQTGSSTQ